MIKIPLTKNKFTITDNSFSHLRKYKWHFLSNGYAVHTVSRKLFPDKKQRKILFHHCVIGFPLNNLEVDHIDGNRLNNKASNLRIVTHRQNHHNRIEFRLGTKSSKYIGVGWHKKRGKWFAQIQIKGRCRHLGYFTSELEASKSYQEIIEKIKES